MPELGVPVSFSEIKNVSILCEVARMHEGLNPDLSLGTHFFNDLVDMDILYMGISPLQTGSALNEALLKDAPNRLLTLLPEAAPYAEMIRVVDSHDVAEGQRLLLHADTLEQRGVVFLANVSE